MNHATRLPFSGAVTQAINPWDFMIKSVGSQMGFINIRNVSSTDPRIEQDIVENVASYGRQLGQIAEALKVLLNHSALENLQSSESDIITRFEHMLEDIEHVKQKWKTPRHILSQIDSLVADIQDLKNESTATYELAMAKIKTKLDLREV